MSVIRILDDRLVNKIAAGEVVERPASIIKELLENSVDAGATAIEVRLGSGGRQLVEIADDGCGMDASDALMCLERHATSKIRTQDDLFNIATLGFRGEALPSIASVCKFEIVSRPRGKDVGTRVVVEGGIISRNEPVGCPPGTRISARQLFYNVPARRKFLRTVPTELGHCLEGVIREALIHPEIDWRVEHDGSEVLRAPRVKTRAERASDLLKDRGKALFPVAFESGTLAVEGLISPVGVHHGSSAGAMYLYVNGRFVRDPVLRRAVNDAYKHIVPKGRYPTVVLSIRVPPVDVDVNVHPNKTEVRFRYARDLQSAIAQGIRDALEDYGIRRPVNERRPASDVADARGETMALPLADAPSLPAGAPPMAGQPSSPWAAPPERSHGVSPLLRTGPVDPIGRRPDGSLSPLPPAAMSDAEPLAAAPAALPPLAGSPFEPVPGGLSASPAPQPVPQPVPLPAPVPVPIPEAPAFTLPDALLPVARFQDLRVIGQFALTYLLCEGGGELIVIDQHAAHERITLYNLQKAAREQLGGAQRLLTPVLVELTAGRASLLAENLAVLEQLSLDVEHYGGGTFAIRALPAGLKNQDMPQLLEDIADDLAEGGRGAPALEMRDRVLNTMACHNSIRAAQTLSPYEMRELLKALDGVDFSVCAHGRPVAIRVDQVELERRFHRS